MTAAKVWPSRTADGRETFSAEFRPIPGFSRYRITADGDVQNVATGRLLKESENRITGAYSYTLIRDDGRSTTRNYRSLVRDAWGTNV